MLHRDREREGEEREMLASPAYLLIRMTMVVMMAARKTNPPNTPRAIISPEIENISVDEAEKYFQDIWSTELLLESSSLG